MAPSSGGHLQGWQPSRIITIVLVLNSSSARVAPHREPWWGGCSKSSKKQRPWHEHVPPLEESRWDILLVAEGYRWARGQGMSLYLLVDPAWNRWPWEAWPEGSRAHARVCVSPTLCDPTDHSPPGSSVHGILQARILGWVAIPFSTGSSRPRH